MKGYAMEGGMRRRPSNQNFETCQKVDEKDNLLMNACHDFAVHPSGSKTSPLWGRSIT